MRFLASTKAQFHKDFHAGAEKPDSVIEFRCEIVSLDARGELKLFHFIADALRMLVALGFFVQQFAVLRDAAYWRRGIRHCLDQVQALALGEAQGIRQRHNTELLPGFVNHADFAGANFTIATVFGLPRLE